MNKIAQNSGKNNWQTDRAQLLQRACLSLQTAILNGGKVCKTLQRVARRYHGRCFKSDPARQLRLSPLTLRRAWNAWRRSGQLPRAFQLNFHNGGNVIPSPLLVRFTNYCARRQFRSLKSAWQKFSMCGGNFGRGRRPNAGLKIPCRRLYRHFRADDFYELQGCLGKIEAEQIKLEKLRDKISDDLRRRLPEKSPCTRRKTGINFEI